MDTLFGSEGGYLRGYFSNVSQQTTCLLWDIRKVLKSDNSVQGSQDLAYTMIIEDNVLTKFIEKVPCDDALLDWDFLQINEWN